MLLTREEKQRLNQYLLNLEWFIIEQTDDSIISRLRLEADRIKSRLSMCGVEPLFEIITKEGDLIKRFASAVNLERHLGLNTPKERNTLLSRLNQEKNRRPVYKKKYISIVCQKNVFSVPNKLTGERTFIRILENF